jgi:hypothetical protein
MNKGRVFNVNHGFAPEQYKPTFSQQMEQNIPVEMEDEQPVMKNARKQ